MKSPIRKSDGRDNKIFPVLVEHKDGISWLRLNKPDRLNALSAAMIEGLIGGLDEAFANRSSLVIFTGEGKTFSAGFDLSELDTQSDADLLCRFIRIEQLLQNIYLSPITTVALISGCAFGAAADMIAVCHHRIASPDSSFRMPGLQFGVVLGTRRLAALIGSDAALDLLETSRIFGANDALDNGFITNIKTKDDWPDLVLELIRKASSLDPAAKKALHLASRSDVNIASSMNADLAGLVKSCAEPGLRNRIRNFVITQVKR